MQTSNNAPVPSANNETCGNTGCQNTLGGNYTTQYVYTNLGQLWQGPLNGGGTQEQYLYCDSAHPHQLSNLSQTSSNPTCSGKGTVDYTGSYDAWGNVTSQIRGGITRTPIYDGQDHLVRWSSSVNNQEEWNLYDSSGERVLRRTYDGSNTAITVFAFGIEEHAYSYSGSGSSDTNTSNTYYYHLGDLLLGTWDGSSATTTFLLTDTLGSVVSSFNNLASGAAVVLGNQAYGPYGNRRTQQGTIGTSKGFTGQYSDFVTALDYYGARYYDPVIGVFLSADVVQGNAQGMDPYSYAGANPETNTDPTGQRFISGDTPVGSQTAVIEPNHVISIETPGQGTTIISPYVVGPTILPNPSLDQSKVTRALSHSTSNQIHDPVQAACESSGVFGCNYGTHYAVHIGTMTFSVPGEWSSGNKADPGGGDYNVNNVNEEGLIDEAGPCSFTSQTKVATKQGEQTIGTMQVGEKVWAYNPQTKRMELQPVLHVWIHQDNDLVDLTITSSASSKHVKEVKQTSEVLHTNKKHPFLTVEKGFLPVGQIKLGMHVVEASEQVGVVSGWKLVLHVMTMYNLEVAHDHTFTVGGGMWVVHNCGVTGTPDPANAVDGHEDLYKGQAVDDVNLSNNGWTTSTKLGGEDNIEEVKSTNFKEFLADNGKNPSSWRYRMQTWVKGKARIKNHYWYDPGDPDFGQFHHH